MGFRLRHGLNVVVTLGVFAACNTYGPDLLLDGEPDTTNTSDTSDSTLTTGSGGSTSQATTTSNTVTGTSTSGGDGGSGSSSTGSGNDTTTSGGGSGGDSTTSSTGTDSDTTTTGAGVGGNGGSGGSGSSVGSDTTSGGGSSGGGGSGTGGTGGSSTTGIDVLLIDDLEDGNNQLETPTYSGYWFTAVDATGDGEVTPEPGEQCRPVNLDTPRGESKRAMHVSGTWTGGEDWIAAVGFALQDDEAPVDASDYSGVTFYARTDNEDTQIRLQVMITDVEENEDNGHYAIELPLSNSWEQHTVRWTDELLIQPSWAIEVDFDPAHLYKFQFQFDSESFDLWIDDFRFVP